MGTFFKELESFCTFYVLNASFIFQNALKMIIVLYDQRPVACAVLPFLK